MAGFRLVGAVNAIAIEGSGPDALQTAVKDLIGVFGQGDALGLAAMGRIEQAQLDPRRMRREQREIGASAVPGRAAWDRAVPP